MKYVFMLKHSRHIEKKVTSSRLIGFYSSMDKANAVIEKYKLITGFKDYPNDFVIEKMEIDFDDYDFEVEEMM